MDEETKKKRGMVTRASAKRSPTLVIHSPSASGTTLMTTNSQIRRGAAYQVEPGDWEKADGTMQVERSGSPDRDEVVWQPPEDCDEVEMDAIVEYCDRARQHHGLSADKALFVLYREQWVIPAAELRIAHHVDYAHQWSEDDRQLFLSAFGNYGKNFGKIRQLLPHKSIGSLVEHYYNTKKMQYYRSCMDDENEQLSGDDAEAERVETHKPGTTCENCRQEVVKLAVVADTALCRACEQYYKKNGSHRPCKRPPTKGAVKCPPDMGETARAFEQMAMVADDFSAPSSDGGMGSRAGFLVPMKSQTKCEKLVEQTMHTICETKGRASRLLTAPTGEKEAGDKPDNTVQEARNYLKQLGTAAQRSKTTDEYWGFRERQAVFTCLMRYRCDVRAAAEIVGTKSLDEVRAYLHENLDDIKKNMDKEKKVPQEKEKASDADAEPPSESPLNAAAAE